jgi:hypothetical protein
MFTNLCLPILVVYNSDNPRIFQITIFRYCLEVTSKTEVQEHVMWLLCFRVLDSHGRSQATESYRYRCAGIDVCLPRASFFSATTVRISNLMSESHCTSFLKDGSLVSERKLQEELIKTTVPIHGRKTIQRPKLQNLAKVRYSISTVLCMVYYAYIFTYLHPFVPSS